MNFRNNDILFQVLIGMLIFKLSMITFLEVTCHNSLWTLMKNVVTHLAYSCSTSIFFILNSYSFWIIYIGNASTEISLCEICMRYEILAIHSCISQSQDVPTCFLISYEGLGFKSNLSLIACECILIGMVL